MHAASPAAPATSMTMSRTRACPGISREQEQPEHPEADRGSPGHQEDAQPGRKGGAAHPHGGEHEGGAQGEQEERVQETERELAPDDGCDRPAAEARIVARVRRTYSFMEMKPDEA